MESQYRYQKLEKIIIEDKTPIYKGCSNVECLCTGECRKVIGYVDKLDISKITKPVIDQYDQIDAE